MYVVTRMPHWPIGEEQIQEEAGEGIFVDSKKDRVPE